MATVVNVSALDRPVWSALTTGDRRFAEGGSLALRFPPDIAPFAATTDDSPEAFAEFARVSFASGFTTVLIVAGVTAALAAALTFGFVSPVETAPIRLRAVPDTGTPELLD